GTNNRREDQESTGQSAGEADTLNPAESSRGLTSLQLEEMSQLLFLCAEITGGIFRRINFDRYSFNNLQSGFFKRLKLQRIIRDDSHFAESKIEKYLRTLPVISQVYRQTESFICFNSIGTLVL